MTIHKGLDGLLVDQTAISKVDIHSKTLRYRGYSVNDLCKYSTFLETAYLLIKGSLPTLSEYKELCQFEQENRTLPSDLIEFYQNLPKKGHMMDRLKIGVAALGLHLQEDHDLQDESALQTQMFSLFSKLPALMSCAYRSMEGLDPLPTRTDLDYLSHFLYLLTGQVPETNLFLKVLDTTLILYAEHGFNASTFSARVTASTLSDYYSSIVSAIGTLKGPLHGGANEAVMYMLQEIKNPDEAIPWLKKKLENKEKVMGFGHRLYRTGDSRVPIIDLLGHDLADHVNDHKWHTISDHLERYMLNKKNIYPNLDFPVAPAYYLLGIPICLYTPIFVASRITGWSAHLLEQYQNNRLIRPSCDYIGAGPREVIPLKERL